MSSISNPSELQVTGVAFFGRTFAEYSSFFDLAPAALVGRRMLDVAAGPSSFTAEARSLGIDAVAVDPLYGLSCEALAAYVQIDYARMIAETGGRLRPASYPTTLWVSPRAAMWQARSRSCRLRTAPSTWFSAPICCFSMRGNSTSRSMSQLAANSCG